MHRMREKEGKIIVAGLFLADQATKALFLETGRGFVNSGLSLGLWAQIPVGLLLAFNLLFLTFFFRFRKTLAGKLVLTGGVSNLLDRLVRGGVVDFATIFRLPAFNLADVMIVVGCLWLLIDLPQTKKVS